MKKVLGYKPYKSLGHLIESRLGEGDHHIDQKTNDFLTTQPFENQHKVIYIEEKMDGSNVCVARINGEIKAMGRSGFDAETSNLGLHRMFHKWVMINKEKFEKLLINDHDRVCGEWMALAHGTIYKKSHFDQPFLVFDLFMGKENPISVESRIKLINSVGLENVPMLYKSNIGVSVQKALSFLDNPDAEGVVYRAEKTFKQTRDSYEFNQPWIVAKVVKKDKVDGKYLKNKDNNQLPDEEKIWHFLFDDSDNLIDKREL